MSEWMKGRTAPKDGTPILAFYNDHNVSSPAGEIVAVSYDASGRKQGRSPWRVAGTDDRIYADPALWMPQPPFPKVIP